jgi:hypothetical protein
MMDCDAIGLGSNRFDSPRSITGWTNLICNGWWNWSEEPPPTSSWSMIIPQLTGLGMRYKFVRWCIVLPFGQGLKGFAYLATATGQTNQPVQTFGGQKQMTLFINKGHWWSCRRQWFWQWKPQIATVWGCIDGWVASCRWWNEPALVGFRLVLSRAASAIFWCHISRLPLMWHQINPKYFHGTNTAPKSPKFLLRIW